MTDATFSPGARVVDVSSDVARARIAARYRAERRFRAYGMAAIAFAGLFLVLLLADIVWKALPAFTQSVARLEVTLDKADLDPSGSGDVARIAQEGNFAAPVQKALQAKFPDVTNRAERRRLIGLLSSGAGDDLRRRFVADPSLIGRTIEVPVLFSDDADLYLSGRVTATSSLPSAVAATPSGTEGTVTVKFDGPVFDKELARLRADLGREAELLAARLATGDRDLGAARRNLELATARLADVVARGDTARKAGAEGELAKAKSDVASLERSLADLRQRAEGLAARARATGGSEALDGGMPSFLVTLNGGTVRATRLAADSIEGDVLVKLAGTATAAPGTWSGERLAVGEANRKVSDAEIAYLDRLDAAGVVERRFATGLFTSGDSREPEQAGLLGALVGSLLTMMVTLSLVLPIGVLAAIYLEEFAPKNRVTDFIEVNINNLAAVPSIVFGLLGLAVFLNFFGLPRSAPLVGGLVLALLTLPTIIIAARAALKAVPPSIREAALGVGASHQQAVFHHVLPLAMPGIMTGTIIGMAHALGETAPLLMIGMVAFIVDVPQGVTQAATVLPVQIYLWSDLPEVAFQAKTAAAILVLLGFLFVMNGAAILLRKRFERRW